MMMKYTSDNGYTGTLSEGIFLGMQHWDYTVRDKSGQMVFHTALSEPYTEDQLKKEVDGFPDFLELLCSMSGENKEK